MSNTALGLIETYGYTASVEAADVCLKAANVSLSACKKVRGGLVTIEIIGDVGAVKAAIDAAEAAVPRVGKLISTHVIPRPAAELDSILGDNSFNSNAPEDPNDPNDPQAPNEQDDSRAEENQENAPKSEAKTNDSDLAAKKEQKEAGNSKKETETKAEKPKTKTTKNEEKAKKEQPTKKELKEHKVVELRSLARELENIKLSNKEIKYARKKELIKAILDAKSKRSDT